MKPINALLSLLLWRCIAAVETGCFSLPKVENADILDSSLKNNYTEGDLLHFTCRDGYVSSRRITYECMDRRWTMRGRVKCSPKQCELPEDITNGYYDIVNGTDFVFGSVIKYTCNEGYVLVGKSDTRLCMSEGWSDRVPSCEVVKCSAEINYDNMIVSGLGDDSSVSYGHILHFKCMSSDVNLKGEAEVTCLSNGQWSSSFPTCGGKEHVKPEISATNIQPSSPQPKGYCGPPPTIPFGDIKGLKKDTYGNGAEVEYQCMRYYTLSKKFIKCLQGQWTDSPTCLEPCIVTIEKMEQKGIQPRWGHSRKLYAAHTVRVQFDCRRGKKLVHGNLIQYCNNGEMDYPTCT